MKILNRLESVLVSQRFAILATSGKNGPYQNIVAFAPTKDAKRIIFVTPRQTSKYRNLKRNGNASIFIDDRSNSERDIGEAIGVCAVGEAVEIAGSKLDAAIELYSSKHPAMRDFAASPDNAVFSMEIHKYLMASGFQKVDEIVP